MKNLYYKIWVDCIIKAKSIPANKTSWKTYTLVLMSMAMALNLMVFMLILQKFILHSNFYFLDVNVFPGKKLDSFVSFLILFLFPVLVLNYLLIFKENRYKHLIKRYQNMNGRLFTFYFLGSLFLPFIALVIGFIFFRK